MFKANLKWIKTKSNHVNSETKKAFTSDYSQVRLRLCEGKEGWKYPCYYCLHYYCCQYKRSTATSISKTIYDITKIHPSTKPMW